MRACPWAMTGKSSFPRYNRVDDARHCVARRRLCVTVITVEPQERTTTAVAATHQHTNAFDDDGGQTCERTTRQSEKYVYFPYGVPYEVCFL